MMLNTDMELAFEIDVDASAGTTSCAPVETEELGACQAAQTASLVQTYAEVRFLNILRPTDNVTNWGFKLLVIGPLFATSLVSPDLLHSWACSRSLRNLAREQLHSKVISPIKALNL